MCAVLISAIMRKSTLCEYTTVFYHLQLQWCTRVFYTCRALHDTFLFPSYHWSDTSSKRKYRGTTLFASTDRTVLDTLTFWYSWWDFYAVRGVHGKWTLRTHLTGWNEQSLRARWARPNCQVSSNCDTQSIESIRFWPTPATGKKYQALQCPDYVPHSRNCCTGACVNLSSHHVCTSGPWVSMHCIAQRVWTRVRARETPQKGVDNACWIETPSKSLRAALF